MRNVIVTSGAIREAYRTGGRKIGGCLHVTGSDVHSGELVTFAGDALVLAEYATLVDGIYESPDGGLEVEVGEADVISVVAPEPVSGEWDSPGTSEEF
jgi:hypothetical protein